MWFFRYELTGVSLYLKNHFFMWKFDFRIILFKAIYFILESLGIVNFKNIYKKEVFIIGKFN